MPPRRDIPADLLRRSSRARAPVAYESPSPASSLSPPPSPGPSTQRTPAKSAKPKATPAATPSSSKAKPQARGKVASTRKNGESQPSTPQAEFPWDKVTEWHASSQKKQRSPSPAGFDRPPDSGPPSKRRKATPAASRKSTPKRPSKANAARKPDSSSSMSSAGEEAKDPGEDGQIPSSSHVPRSQPPPSPKRRKPDSLPFPPSSSPLSPSHEPVPHVGGTPPSPFLDDSLGADLPDFDADSEDDDEDLEAALAKAGARAGAALKQVALAADPHMDFKPTKLPVGIEPGSACYSKEVHCFFPAVLVSFEPATTAEDQAKQKDRYEVLDQSGNRKIVPRRAVIFPEDQEIATCILGKVKIEVARPPRGETGPRPPTPELELPSSSMDGDAFRALDWARQLVAIRPHLADVIAERYPPAQWRVDQFFRSGISRSALRSEIDIGDVREDEQVKEIIPELRRWVMREPGEDGGNGAGPPTRAPGSARFEALTASGPELTDYLQTVLMPEALIAICIRSSDGPDDVPSSAPEPEDTQDSQAAKSPTDNVEATTNPTQDADDHPAPPDTNGNGNARRLSSTQEYLKARDTLRLLADNDIVAWSVRLTELKSARKRMREKLKLPAELDGGDVEGEADRKIRAERVREMISKKEQERELAYYSSLKRRAGGGAAPAPARSPRKARGQVPS